MDDHSIKPKIFKKTVIRETITLPGDWVKVVYENGFFDIVTKAEMERMEAEYDSEHTGKRFVR